MNAKELNDKSIELEHSINKYYWYNIGNDKSATEVMVYALASKLTFGRILLQVTPVFGTGSFWIKRYRLREITNPTIHINSGFKTKEVILFNHSDNVTIKLSPYYPEINLN